ncbi:MAG: hypothetical protein AAB883_00895 [Patescibacteria group bacterium]
MNVEWNRVTQFSQLIAIVLFVGIFALGFYLGTLYQQHAFQNAVDDALNADALAHPRAATSSTP